MTTYDRIRELEHKARAEHILVEELAELAALYGVMSEPVPEDMRLKINELIRE